MPQNQLPPVPLPDPGPDRRRLIDFSLPLPWIIGMFFSVVGGLVYIGWVAADQKNLLGKIVESQAESKVRQSELNTRMDTLRDQFMEIKQTQAIQSIRIGTMERDGVKK